ncbi:MAG: hypothetical protein ACR2IK_24595 [Chloroflexota bacterium]
MRWIRYVHGIASPPLLATGEVTVAGVADRLGLSPNVIYYWLEHGQLAARRAPGGKWCIPFPPEVEQAYRERAATSGHLGRQLQISAA